MLNRKVIVSYIINASFFFRIASCAVKSSNDFERIARLFSVFKHSVNICISAVKFVICKIQNASDKLFKN